MKIIITLAAFLTISLFSNSGTFGKTSILSQNICKYSENSPAEQGIITYVRIYHDGFWWIQTYECGLLKSEILDPIQE